MGLHKNLTGVELHTIHAFTYADAIEREAAIGFTSSDIGKVAKQSDNTSFWILTETTPTWSEITGLTGGNYHNYITVGVSGPVNFNTIADGIQQAITAGANSLNPITVAVYPGTYIENNPITIPTGVTVSTISGEREPSLIVKPLNPSDDLFVMTGGSLLGVSLSGITDPLKACIRAGEAGRIANIHGCSVTNCSNGVIIENGATAVLTSFVAAVVAANSAIDTAIYVDGYGSRLIISESLFNVPAALLSFYVGNPLNTAVHADNGCIVDILNSTFQITANDTNQSTILIDNPNTTARIIGCNFDNGSNAIHITSSSTNGLCSIIGSTIFNYTLNYNIESSTGVIFEQITTDSFKQSIVTGGSVNGISGELADSSSNAIGLFHYVYSKDRQVPISRFIYDQISSGLRTNSGIVTSAGGLDVNISDGYGWIRRLTEQDVDDVTWSATTITLDPNATNYIYFDANSSIITSNTSGTNPDSIQLATVFTNGTDVTFIHNTSNIVVNVAELVHTYLLTTRKFALNNGLTASSGSDATKFTIGSGSYYITTTLISYAGTTDATFSYFYDGGNVELPAQTDVDIFQYDNGGMLTTMTDGYFRADTIYLTSDGRISVIYGTEEFDNITDAGLAAKAVAPVFIEPSGFSIATMVIEKTVGITGFVDHRPQPALGGSGGVSSGVTDHGLLSGLSDDDHPQYILADGTRSMAGNLDLDSHNIINVNLVDGVDVSNHGLRHNPGQIDSISTAAPVGVLVGATSSEGSAASVARSDHQHGITSGTPVSISNVNNAGSASTVSRSDHVHAHGTLAGGNTHALVISDPGGSAGYMSPSDKQKLNGIASNATNTPLTSIIPVSVNKSVSLAGSSTEAARQDHKHNIDTATPGTISVGDSALEGSSTSLARSDHTHALTAPAAPANVDATTAAAGSATTVARSDHKHNVNVGTPVAIGIANNAGSATTLARSDHVHRGVLLQTVFAEINTDTTTTSTAFVDLLSQSITTTGGDLIIHMTTGCSNTNNNQQVLFRITVDGTIKRGVGTVASAGANNIESASIIIKVTGLSSAAHIVKVQWRVTANTGQIRPVTAPDEEHISLLISEVTV